MASSAFSDGIDTWHNIGGDVPQVDTNRQNAACPSCAQRLPYCCTGFVSCTPSPADWMCHLCAVSSAANARRMTLQRMQSTGDAPSAVAAHRLSVIVGRRQPQPGDPPRRGVRPRLQTLALPPRPRAAPLRHGIYLHSGGVDVSNRC